MHLILHWCKFKCISEFTLHGAVFTVTYCENCTMKCTLNCARSSAHKMHLMLHISEFTLHGAVFIVTYQEKSTMKCRLNLSRLLELTEKVHVAWRISRENGIFSSRLAWATPSLPECILRLVSALSQAAVAVPDRWRGMLGRTDGCIISIINHASVKMERCCCWWRGIKIRELNYRSFEIIFYSFIF